MPISRNDYMVTIKERLVNPKGNILQFIKDNPGTYLRRIKNSLGYSIGTTQYHVYLLEKEGKIISKKCGFFRNYYHVGISDDKRELLSVLNLESPRKIIFYLLENEPCSHMEIAKGVGLSPSTISWHMKRLFLLGFINLKYDGKFSIYSIKNKSELLESLNSFPTSTWNDMISNLTDIVTSFQD